MIPALVEAAPRSFKAYHELMCGGAALFWHYAGEGMTRNRRATLSDVNEAVIRTYWDLRENAHKVATLAFNIKAAYEATTLENAESIYYEEREKWNAGETDSGRYLFLKASSFNGVWRENRKGAMNSPWNRKKHAALPMPSVLFEAGEMLVGVRLIHGSYEKALRDIDVKRQDFLYFDPPYVSTLDYYNADDFDTDAQVNLLDHCAELSKKSYVLYNNHSDALPAIRHHWPEARYRAISTLRPVNRDGTKRGAVDLVVTDGHGRGIDRRPYGLPVKKVKKPVQQAG